MVAVEAFAIAPQLAAVHAGQPIVDHVAVACDVVALVEGCRGRQTKSWMSVPLSIQAIGKLYAMWCALFLLFRGMSLRMRMPPSL